MDVYVIALLISAWQLGPISKFMVNEYCSDLTNSFTSFVLYGIIDRDDAQCFKVDVKILGGTYAFICSALLLALLNTFVTKAIAQYLMDKSRSCTTACGRKTISNDQNSKLGSYWEEGSFYGDNDTTTATIIKRIHPVPVAFTDKFRWFLCRENKNSTTSHLETSNTNMDEESASLP